RCVTTAGLVEAMTAETQVPDGAYFIPPAAGWNTPGMGGASALISGRGAADLDQEVDARVDVERGAVVDVGAVHEPLHHVAVGCVHLTDAPRTRGRDAQVRLGVAVVGTARAGDRPGIAHLEEPGAADRGGVRGAVHEPDAHRAAVVAQHDVALAVAVVVSGAA